MDNSSNITRSNKIVKSSNAETQEPTKTKKNKAVLIKPTAKKEIRKEDTEFSSITKIEQRGQPVIKQHTKAAAQSNLEDVEWTQVNTKKKPAYPMLLFSNVIVKSIRKFAANEGLGKDADLKSIPGAKKYMQNQLNGKEFRFGPKSADGEGLLEGMFFESKDIPKGVKQKTILLCTGSNGPSEQYAFPLVQAFKEMGHNVMIFNYEGFGDSGGEKSEAGVYRSVEAAYEFLINEKHCQDDDIVAWGYSLGSGAVSHLASKTSGDIDIVVDRGFASMSQVGKEQFENKLMQECAKIVMNIGAHFDNVANLSNYPGNVFIAYGRDDDVMKNKTHVSRLQAAIGDNAQVLEVPSAHLHTSTTVWLSKIDEEELKENFKDLIENLKQATVKEKIINKIIDQIKDPEITVEDIQTNLDLIGEATKINMFLIDKIKKSLEKKAVRDKIENFLNRPPRNMES